MLHCENIAGHDISLTMHLHEVRNLDDWVRLCIWEFYATDLTFQVEAEYANWCYLREYTFTWHGDQIIVVFYIKFDLTARRFVTLSS